MFHKWCSCAVAFVWAMHILLMLFVAVAVLIVVIHVVVIVVVVAAAAEFSLSSLVIVVVVGCGCWFCGCRCCCYNLIDLRAALVGFADKSTGSGSRRGQLGSIQKVPHNCPIHTTSECRGLSTILATRVATIAQICSCCVSGALGCWPSLVLSMNIKERIKASQQNTLQCCDPMEYFEIACMHSLHPCRTTLQSGLREPSFAQPFF